MLVMPGDSYNAWIVTVGNEILIGRIVNTNAAWLAKQLSLLGYNVERIVAVPDKLDDIAEEVARAASKARVVLTTGGLGPTYDDITLEGVARAFGLRLELNKQALAMIEEFYQEMGLPLTNERVKMAYLPQGATPLANPVGAAPGSLLIVDDVVVASLPGVPREMEAMFKNSLFGMLRERGPGVEVVDCGIIVRGVPESSLAPYIRDIAKRHPRAYTKSHPKGHETRGPILEIRVVTSSETREGAIAEARSILDEIRKHAERLGGETSKEDCTG